MRIKRKFLRIASFWTKSWGVSQNSNNVYLKKLGLTAIEVLMALLVLGIMVIVIALFVGQSFGVKREHFEQTRNTEGARVQIERISDAIRNARNVDCDGDGQTDENEFWIQEAEPYALTIHTNIDDDNEVERVRYYVEEGSSELRMRVEHDNPAPNCEYPPGQTTDQTIIKSLRNRMDGNDQALFGYYVASVGGAVEMSYPVEKANISLVRIFMNVDVDTEKGPSDAMIETMVDPRGLKQRSCPSMATTNFSYNYDDDFVPAAFNECMDYCGGEQPGGGCCWWHVDFTHWDGDPYGEVQTQCSCTPFFISSYLTKVNLNTEDYTDYVKACLTFNGGLCGDGNLGIPYCEPGCMETGVQGQCACDCPTF